MAESLTGFSDGHLGRPESSDAVNFIDDVTAVILTYNEEDNIERTLCMLDWAQRILVIDSGSTDETLSLLARYDQVEVIHRAFDTFAGQCNFALSHVFTCWVLSIDADYDLSEEFVTEVTQLKPAVDVAGYRAGFTYRVFGKPLSGTLYPPRTVLYRKATARYENEGHGHRVVIDGKVESVRSKIFHDDRKPLSRWFASQKGYAEREADYLLSEPVAKLRIADRIRRWAWPAPFLVFFYSLLVKRCLFDGKAGWYYVLQRTVAEIMIALAIIDRRLRNRDY